MIRITMQRRIEKFLDKKKKKSSGTFCVKPLYFLLGYNQGDDGEEDEEKV